MSCCDHDHGGAGGHEHAHPNKPQQKVQLNPQQIEFMKKLETQRQELIHVANFISKKGLKFKNALFNDSQFDFFRGNICLTPLC